MSDSNHPPSRAGTPQTPTTAWPVPVCAAADPAAHLATLGCRRMQSSELMQGEAEIEIQHGNALYRLRLTALGKLILTK